MFPVENRDIQRRIRKLLDLYFEDNCKAHELAPDGSWTRVKPPKNAPRVRTQEIAYQRIRERLSGDEPENRQEFKVRRRPPE